MLSQHKALITNTSIENIQIFIVGNSVESNKYIPEFVSISSDKNQPKLAYNDITFKDVWLSHIYGMVGTIINQEIYICGGGVLPSTCPSIDNVLLTSTSRCQSYDLKKYNLTTLDVSMTEERTFAQSMMFGNNTWYIMGGQDSQGIASDTSEYFTANGTIFVNGLKLPEHFSHHCAKLINTSHLFTTGGSKYSSLGQTYLSLLSRGYKIFDTVNSFKINSDFRNVFKTFT